MSEAELMRPICPICKGEMNPGRKTCSTTCRVKALWIRRIDMILGILREELHKAVDEFFEKARNLLVEKLVK